MNNTTQHNWDLSKFCKNDQEWYQNFEKLKPYEQQFASFKGKLGNKQTLLQFFKLEEEFEEIASKLAMYCSNHANVDLANDTYTEMSNLLQGLGAKLGKATSFVSPELLRYEEQYLQEVRKDPDFADYDFAIFKLIRQKAHVLSEKEERILTGAGAFAGEFGEIFDKLTDANFVFEPVLDAQGNKQELTNSTYGFYMNQKDRVLRKHAFENLYKQYEQFSDTIASNYVASLKADWFFAEASNYPSVLEAHLYGDNIDKSVYTRLIDNVNKQLPLLHKYYTLKGKLLGLNDFGYWDLYVTPSSLQKTVEFEEGMEQIKAALSVLGQDYVELLTRSVQERWMDVYPAKNKRSGAYQTSCYGITPVVLLNYKNQVDDVFTVAHELGHAMHSYFANLAQPQAKADYTIFLAEVASTVNEVLLLKHLYANATTKQEKIYYLDQYLQMFKGTIFRQTMFSEFEQFAHELVEQNAPISKQILSQKYEALNKAYQGTSVAHANQIKWEWLRIPHFYSPYYVFKYATGLTSAICIASNIANKVPGSVQNYKQYLQSGGSKFSVETLKLAGVNLETDEPYQVAFAEMNWALQELDKLV